MRKPAGGDVPAMYGGMGDPGPAGEESLAPAVESLADRQERRLSEVLVPVWGSMDAIKTATCLCSH